MVQKSRVEKAKKEIILKYCLGQLPLEHIFLYMEISLENKGKTKGFEKVLLSQF